MTKKIKIKNAKVHNLKSLSTEIPKNKLTVVTGLSGSGKSSLAFDTIYAEGQRRYAESMSAQARKFMEIEDKPDVEDIEGLSPTIAIEQKNTSQNPRSTVGTATEIYDMLRLLFARAGTQYDPETGEKATQSTLGEIAEKVKNIIKESSEDERFLLLSPIIRDRKIEEERLLSKVEPAGYDTLRINEEIISIHDIKDYEFDTDKKYTVELVIDEFNIEEKTNIPLLVDRAEDLSNGFVRLVNKTKDLEYTFSTIPYCKESGKEFRPLETRNFSFNSPYGTCQRCTGLGYTMEVDPELTIPNKGLSIDEGAIQPLTRLTGNKEQRMKLLEELADEYSFSIEEPVQELSDKVIDVILYGDNNEYKIDGETVRFQGIIPELTQRYNDTDSDYIQNKIEKYMKERECPVCKGKRLRQESLSVKVGDYSIADITVKTIQESQEIFQEILNESKSVTEKLTSQELEIAKSIAKEVNKKLENLLKVGLHYLTLNRAANTLSGGESQRIRLATQISTGLTNVVYVLDEPSIGLHARDNDKLIETLKNLRDQENTVIVVEHDKQTIEEADHIIDLGPGAGKHGGKIIAEGSPEDIMNEEKSLTAGYMTGKEKIECPEEKKTEDSEKLTIKGAKAFNLRNIDVDIPLEKFVCVTGVSGSGKSTLVTKILSKALHKEFHNAKTEPEDHESIEGTEHLNKIITIDQQPIGRTPRSNPATYTGVFTPIREIYADTPEAKMRGFDTGHFSFNVKGAGRCEACSGNGYKEVSMQFMSNVYIKCPECQGKRYNEEVLEVHFRQKNIAEVLDLTIHEAYRFFNDHASIAKKLKIMRDVGLGYLRLGQPATTLSGGEAQRIKLAKELARKSTGDTLYILDEPTTGLHFEDVKRLLSVLIKLVEKGNTVLTIEHNLDVIKCADHVIDMGPEGGKGGGQVIAKGTPKDITEVEESYTGKYLKEVLEE